MMKLSEFCAFLEKISPEDLANKAFEEQYSKKCFIHWQEIFE